MITVYDKLKLFSEEITKKVEEESKQKLKEFSDHSKEILEEERNKAIKQAQAIVDSMKRKAEAEARQIVSRAGIEKEHMLLSKKKEIFESVIQDMRNKANEFTHEPQYRDILEKCIDRGISEIKDKNIIILFKPSDISAHQEWISFCLNKYRGRDINVNIGRADTDIIGGCICVNGDKTLRVDCTISSSIDDSRELIGRALMDNLR